MSKQRPASQRCIVRPSSCGQRVKVLRVCAASRAIRYLGHARLRRSDETKADQGGQKFILSPEQQAEVANFRKKEAEMKKELKRVKRNLNQEIDSLENQLKWINIAGMPFLVTISGVSLALFKRKQTAAK